MKLKTITFETSPRLPGLRAGEMITLKTDEPGDTLAGWRAIIRGPSVFFVSPPGYVTGRTRREWDPAGPCIMHEVPRAQCYFQWEGSPDEIATIIKASYETPPFGPAPKPVADVVSAGAGKGSILAQLEPHQIGDA